MNKSNNIIQMSKIAEIFRDNLDIAFIIGNGINQHFFKQQVSSWSELISDLSSTFAGIKFPTTLPLKCPKCGYLISDDNYYKAPGYTFTEQFDIIELTHFEKRNQSKEKSSEYPKTSPESIKVLQSLSNIDFDEVLSIVNKKKIKANSNSFAGKQASYRFKSTYELFVESCREWCNQNINSANTLSDVECINRFMDIAISDGKIEINRNIIKRYISMRYSKELYDKNFEEFLEKIEKSNIPILTTNYDHLMSSTLKLKKYRMTKRFTAFYPWNVYYSDKNLKDPTSGFGIWHINGMVEYPQSIKIGLSDYMGNVEYARKMIQGDYFSEFFNGKDQQNWAGYYTWMHILFNRNLFIFGLSLDENEVFLRWLLVQRAKYAKIHNRKVKGWFFDQSISTGKKFFLETLGFEVVDIPHEELYKVLSDNL